MAKTSREWKRVYLSVEIGFVQLARGRSHRKLLAHPGLLFNILRRETIWPANFRLILSLLLFHTGRHVHVDLNELANEKTHGKICKKSRLWAFSGDGFFFSLSLKSQVPMQMYSFLSNPYAWNTQKTTPQITLGTRATQIK